VVHDRETKDAVLNITLYASMEGRGGLTKMHMPACGGTGNVCTHRKHNNKYEIYIIHCNV